MIRRFLNYPNEAYPQNSPILCRINLRHPIFEFWQVACKAQRLENIQVVQDNDYSTSYSPVNLIPAQPMWQSHVSPFERTIHMFQYLSGMIAQDNVAEAAGDLIVPILIACVIGAIAGFLAGQIMKGRGFGLVGNIIVGIIGSAIFSFLFGSLSLFNNTWLDAILGGTLGAVLLLFVISLVKKAT